MLTSRTRRTYRATAGPTLGPCPVQPLPRPPPGKPTFGGQTVLITGSSSGIGAATARLFADLGATVVINSSTSVEAGRALAADLPDASYVQADVSDQHQAQRLIDEVVDRHGRLDVLVNNAGTTEVISHADLEAASPDIWRRIFDVNVIGTWQVTVAAVEPPAVLGARSDPQRVLGGRRTADRQFDPLRLLEGRGQPHDQVAGQLPRARHPGQRGGPRTGRHPLDRRLGLGPGVRRRPRPRCNAQPAPRTWLRCSWDWPVRPTSPARWCWSTGAYTCAERPPLVAGYFSQLAGGLKVV